MNDFFSAPNHRRHIRKKFNEEIRCYQTPPIRPPTGHPPPGAGLSPEEIRTIGEALQGAQAVARILHGSNPQNVGELANAVNQLQALLQEMQARQPTHLPSKPPLVPAHHRPIAGAHHHGEHLAQILRHLQFPEDFCNHFENLENATLWLDSSVDPQADAILRTIARDCFPNGTSHQAGLQTTFNSSQAQGVFQGAQLLEGATLLQSTAQLMALLLPFTKVTQQSLPYLLNTLGLAPFLIGNNAQAALLSGALATQAQAGASGTQIPFLQSLSSFLISQGVSPSDITPNLLNILNQTPGALANTQINPALLQAFMNKVALALQPQTLGLNQAVQNAQNTSVLNQLFGSILKVIMGVLQMQNQFIWPQAAPNDAMLAALAALLAQQSKKAEEEKKRKKTKRKGHTEEHERIEAKEDLEDDSNPSNFFELLLPEEDEEKEEIIDVEYKEI